MAINYPTSLDTLTNPTSTDTLDSPVHSTQHANLNDIAEALEAKVGIGASTPANNQVLTSTGTGVSAWASIDSDMLASVTGADTSIATGTAGAVDEIAKWNTDGDLVTAGYTLAGKASSAETNTGTEADKAITPDGFAGSDRGKRIISILVSDPNGDAITTGDGKAYVRIPSALNGMNLVEVTGSLTTASSSGIPTIQIRNSTQAADMLTTKLTIDANETDSSTAVAAVVIDTANDDVATGDQVHVDIDIAGTGAKGLLVELSFQTP